ncbi:TerC/Alx family metal homeostasis membrane protein [Corynebacterium propinquum]|uniref:TerC/Alx family metal homeostasis membrane protein n=1 Tax=Corynebacterium propinquum TaxID=43769 RepID=UPI00254191B0|nr:TerC/Alx family metal homeostasis membrane protein [Corynebacterium propinquum]MDK4234160.1 TerC/Alx family metal homeostasis membrane protein [Corynebacterium propinquum]
MGVPLVVWLVTIAAIAGFFIFDFYTHVRKPHAPTLKEAGFWSAFYIGIALLFGVVVWFGWDAQHGIEYFTGYVTEKALSIDNLFVFALIIGAFQVPRQYQQKVLLIGIVLALIFRLIFILAGSALISAWSDIFYVFAIFLLYIAIKLVVDEFRDKPETHPNDMLAIKMIRKVMPVTKDYQGDSLVVRNAGKLAVTPLLVALLAIGFVDVMFAFDSIPAIYGITTEAYLVFAANAFSLMGLRQLYFLLDGLLDRLIYLAYGLGVILGFIGIKLLLHALHENNLPFINGGENLSVPEISTVGSLIFIVLTLVVTVVASVIKSRRDVAQGAIDTRKHRPGV